MWFWRFSNVRVSHIEPLCCITSGDVVKVVRIAEQRARRWNGIRRMFAAIHLLLVKRRIR